MNTAVNSAVASRWWISGLSGFVGSFYNVLALSLLLLLSLSGCSVLGQAAKSTLEGTTAAWKLQPAAVRNAYPKWVRSPYYSAELLLSDARDWQLRVRSPQPLQAPAMAEVELAYQVDDDWQRALVPLLLKSEQRDAEFYVYEYQVSELVIAFYQQFQQARFSFQRPRFRYLLQPHFLHNADAKLSNRQQLEYGFLPDYGYLSLGDMMRMINFMPDEEWEWLCDGSHYRFDKGTACGQVKVRDKATLKVP